MEKTVESCKSRLIEMLNGPLETYGPEVWREFEWELNGLKYLVNVKREGDVPSVRSAFDKSICCSNCGVSLNQPDACLLRIGEAWFCRDHIPLSKAGSIKPIGYTVSRTEAEKKEKMTQDALKKLSPEERRLVNSRLV